MSVEPQNTENEEKRKLLSIENDITDKVEKLCKEKMYTHYLGEINQMLVLQGITSTSTASSYVKLTELSRYPYLLRYYNNRSRKSEI